MLSSSIDGFIFAWGSGVQPHDKVQVWMAFVFSCIQDADLSMFLIFAIVLCSFQFLLLIASKQDQCGKICNTCNLFCKS